MYRTSPCRSWPDPPTSRAGWSISSASLQCSPLPERPCPKVFALGYHCVNHRATVWPKESKALAGRIRAMCAALRADRSPGSEDCSERETKEQPVEKLAQNIQEAFLNNARKEKTFLTIY